MGLIVKLFSMQIPVELLKVINSWLNDRKAYIVFGNTKSGVFKTHVGLPQRGSLSPYIFIICYADLINCVRAFPTHLFADDLCPIIVPPVQKSYKEMIKLINSAGSQICQNLFEYSSK
jgi:hypothetical protein